MVVLLIIELLGNKGAESICLSGSRAEVAIAMNKTSLGFKNRTILFLTDTLMKRITRIA